MPCVHLWAAFRFVWRINADAGGVFKKAPHYADVFIPCRDACTSVGQVRDVIDNIRPSNRSNGAAGEVRGKAGENEPILLPRFWVPFLALLDKVFGDFSRYGVLYRRQRAFFRRIGWGLWLEERFEALQGLLIRFPHPVDCWGRFLSGCLL